MWDDKIVDITLQNPDWFGKGFEYKLERFEDLLNMCYDDMHRDNWNKSRKELDLLRQVLIADEINSRRIMDKSDLLP